MGIEPGFLAAQPVERMPERAGALALLAGLQCSDRGTLPVGDRNALHRLFDFLRLVAGDVAAMFVVKA